MKLKYLLSLMASAVLLSNCNNEVKEDKLEITADSSSVQKKEYLSQPLVSHIYTADPSAHLFNGRIYIYPSHDTATGTKEDNLGGHFDMRDYHVLSMAGADSAVTDHGVALDIKNIPWAGRQL